MRARRPVEGGRVGQMDLLGSAGSCQRVSATFSIAPHDAESSGWIRTIPSRQFTMMPSSRSGFGGGSFVLTNSFVMTGSKFFVGRLQLLDGGLSSSLVACSSSLVVCSSSLVDCSSSSVVSSSSTTVSRSTLADLESLFEHDDLFAATLVGSIQRHDQGRGRSVLLLEELMEKDPLLRPRAVNRSAPAMRKARPCSLPPCDSRRPRP